MQSIIIYPVLVEPQLREDDFFTTAVNAMNWLSTRNTVGRHIEACADLAQYLYSYRTREDGTGKITFWKRYWACERSYEEMFGMPKQTRKLQQETRGQLRFLNVRLTDEQLKEADEWEVKPVQVWAALDHALHAGLSLSFSYNSERKTASAMFIDRREESEAANWALSAFSDDCKDALKLLLYKHFELLKEDWIPLLHNDAPRSQRG